MKPDLHNLKKSVELPNGSTLGYTLTGEVVLIDKAGKRRALDTDDAIKWLFYTVADDFPKSPTLPPPSPETVAGAARARKSLEGAKSGSPLTGYRDAAGDLVITLPDGSSVTLPSA